MAFDYQHCGCGKRHIYSSWDVRGWHDFDGKRWLATCLIKHLKRELKKALKYGQQINPRARIKKVDKVLGKEKE